MTREVSKIQFSFKNLSTMSAKYLGLPNNILPLIRRAGYLGECHRVILAAILVLFGVLLFVGCIGWLIVRIHLFFLDELRLTVKHFFNLFIIISKIKSCTTILTIIPKLKFLRFGR